ncbi:unnamed protein product [Brassicogethes aeneus]|uniref:Mannosyltransferase n=1 Tax=Brassicogethes aeneus TaxID=1431903 RepID=A0A9P0FLT9_BRAAE|nr:unnamed protein product [Brassicogethes aeneus]
MKSDNYYTPYWILVALRIFFVFIPQVGYIHPDEFFQSVEIFVGKIFDVEYSPPWEFNTTQPIRSMAVPYFTVGLSYQLLKIINPLAVQFLDINIISPYFLLIFPRLFMCLLSFTVDVCLYKICTNNNEKYQTKLFVLASSYIMIVFGTRTFSNTIELVLLAVLMYFVCESLTFSNILIKKKEYLIFRYENSQNLVERVKFHKLRLILESDNYRNGFFISTVSVLGFFNRPTFLAFAIFPIFFWLYRGIGSKCVMSLQFHLRILALIIFAIPTILIVIVIDSFFYGFLTWGELGMLDMSINSFVFTPLNFLKYNLDSDNLALHGIHPKFLHVAVNIPLLFNSLGIYAIVSIINYCYMIYQCKFHLLPSVRSIKGLMTLSILAPIIILSLFPHQEPRFLIPLILPLCYLHGNSVFPEQDNVIVEHDKNSFKSTNTAKSENRLLIKLWILYNLSLFMLFGFIHQGGVYLATSYLHKDLKMHSLSTEYHIVTSHIYSLPESFLLQKPSDKLYKVKNKTFSYNKRVFLYEEGSKNVSYLVDKLQNIIDINKDLAKTKPKRYKLLVLISRSVIDDFLTIAKTKHLNVYKIKTFHPHFSTETLHMFTDYCLDFMNIYMFNCIPLSYNEYFKKIVSLVGLNLYQITQFN